MMLFICESRKSSLYLMLVIALFLRGLRYVESLRILSRSVPQQALHLQPHTTLQSRLKLHKCRLLHRCRYTGPNDKTHDDYYNQNRENLKNLNSHVSQDTFGVSLKPYFNKVPSTENTVCNSITQFTEKSNIVFDYTIYDGIENHLSLVTTPKYDKAPKPSSTFLKLKTKVSNKKRKLISHIIDGKKESFESSEPSRLERVINWTGSDTITKDQPQDYKLKDKINIMNRKKLLLLEFKHGLDKLERKFYMVTFTKLSNLSAGGSRAENAISFVQSGLFLQLVLLALSVQRAPDVKAKIDTCIGIKTNLSNAERIQLIDDVVSMLPSATHGLIFRWSSRLVLGPGYHVSEEFRTGPAAALRLHMEQLNGIESPEMLTAFLNRMVEEDSNGAIHDTFEPDDISGTVTAIFFTTLYLRSRWRTAPTVLNDSRIFRDVYEDPDRTVRMIRINDMMRYANLTDCDAEALEVYYGKPGLSLLILVPQGPSLRSLGAHVAAVGLTAISRRMKTLRVAADLPLYTLRMSLLLPNKLEGLGLPELLHDDNTTNGELKMSHGLQRLMFWAEAGRTAFKDDGLEWDDPPDMKIVVDRPYLFFVRWHNMTLMNGNFVL